MRLSRGVYILIGAVLGVLIGSRAPLISVIVRINSRDSIHYGNGNGQGSPTPFEPVADYSHTPDS